MTGKLTAACACDMSGYDEVPPLSLEKYFDRTAGPVRPDTAAVRSGTSCGLTCRAGPGVNRLRLLIMGHRSQRRTALAIVTALPSMVVGGGTV
jgi:hypothetical protein